MQAQASRKPRPGTLALGGVGGRDIAIAMEGPGLTRLALMVGTVFDRMTSVDDDKPRG